MKRIKKKNLLFEENQDSQDKMHIKAVSLTKKQIEILKSTPESEKRYLLFKKSRFNPNKMKRFIQNKFDVAISDQSSFIICTALKVFTGELIETAREEMTKADLEGEIQPSFLEKAYSKLQTKFEGYKN